MQCMTYEPCPSLIHMVVSIVEIGEEVMNIVDLIIQVLKPYCVVHMVCILWHVQLLKVVENHPLKLGICRSNVLWRMIDLNDHGLRIRGIIFTLVSSTCSSLIMIIGSNFNVYDCCFSFNQSCVANLCEFHFVHIECGHMVQQATEVFKFSFHINTKMFNELGHENHI